jgi:hypothetical protein
VRRAERARAAEWAWAPQFQAVVQHQVREAARQSAVVAAGEARAPAVAAAALLEAGVVDLEAAAQAVEPARLAAAEPALEPADAGVVEGQEAEVVEGPVEVEAAEGAAVREAEASPLRPALGPRTYGDLAQRNPMYPSRWVGSSWLRWAGTRPDAS